MTTNESSELPIAQNMPITKMLEEIYEVIPPEDDGRDGAMEIIEKVRTLEAEHVANVSRAKEEAFREGQLTSLELPEIIPLIAKAKDEATASERARILKVLEEILDKMQLGSMEQYDMDDEDCEYHPKTEGYRDAIKMMRIHINNP